MKASPEWTSEEKAAHFKRMLGPYFSLLQNLIVQLDPTIPCHGAWPFNVYLDKMKELFEQFPISVEMLRPSRNFSAAAGTLGAQTEFSRHLPITFEDFFTLVHQNLIVVLSTCKDRSLGEDRLKGAVLPNEFKESFKLTEEFRSTYEKRRTTIEVTRSEVITKYNLPLSNHSAQMAIRYQKDGTRIVEGFLMGEARQRWGRTAIEAKILDATKNLPLHSPVNINAQEVSLAWKVQDAQGQVKALNEFNRMCVWGSVYTTIDSYIARQRDLYKVKEAEILDLAVKFLQDSSFLVVKAATEVIQKQQEKMDITQRTNSVRTIRKIGMDLMKKAIATTNADMYDAIVTLFVMCSLQDNHINLVPITQEFKDLYDLMIDTFHHVKDPMTKFVAYGYKQILAKVENETNDLSEKSSINVRKLMQTWLNGYDSTFFYDLHYFPYNAAICKGSSPRRLQLSKDLFDDALKCPDKTKKDELTRELLRNGACIPQALDYVEPILLDPKAPQDFAMELCREMPVKVAASRLSAITQKLLLRSTPELQARAMALYEIYLPENHQEVKYAYTTALQFAKSSDARLCCSALKLLTKLMTLKDPWSFDSIRYHDLETVYDVAYFAFYSTNKDIQKQAVSLLETFLDRGSEYVSRVGYRVIAALKVADDESQQMGRNLIIKMARTITYPHPIIEIIKELTKDLSTRERGISLLNDLIDRYKITMLKDPGKKLLQNLV